MRVKNPLSPIERKLEGWPSQALSLALVLTAVALVVIAVRGTPKVKAAALTYEWLP